MSKIVIDIETIGFDFESYDKKSQEYLLKYAQNKEEEEDVKKRMALYPLTGKIVTIGMLNPETRKGCVLFCDQGVGIEKFEKDGIVYETGNEKEMLEKFWNRIRNYDQVITFNGRGFDIPYLMLRSAINKIKVSKNLMGYRFDHKNHCDLLEQLTFYGSIRKFNLDFYAKSFGIKSSKEEGVDGQMVSEMYKKGEYIAIAEYCARDLLTTSEMYDYWKKYLSF